MQQAISAISQMPDEGVAFRIVEIVVHEKDVERRITQRVQRLRRRRDDDHAVLEQKLLNDGSGEHRLVLDEQDAHPTGYNGRSFAAAGIR